MDAPLPDAAPTFAGYHEEHGAGEPLLLLHGGFCSLEPMRELGDLLAVQHRVLAAERPGHGRTPDTDGPYDYAEMVAGALAHLDALGVRSAHVVGYSDGGIVGLLLARDHPGRVRSLVAISANLHPDAWVPDDYPHVTMPAAAHAAVDEEYARLSPDGAAHAEVVIAKLRALWTSGPQIPADSLAAVVAPTLVMAGEHDAVARAHTESIAAAVPGAGLMIVPGTTHMVVRERPDVVAAAVLAHTGSGSGPDGVPRGDRAR